MVFKTLENIMPGEELFGTKGSSHIFQRRHECEER